MAVEIKLDLDAEGVADEILAVEGALETLDARANEVDLGDALDADGISGEIGQIIKRLDDLEVSSEKLARNLSDSFSEIPDEVEVVHDHQTPDGDTGSGDSTGGDPQRDRRFRMPSGFEEIAEDIGPTAVTDGSGDDGDRSLTDFLDDVERRNRLKSGSVRAYGSSKEDLASLQKDFFHNVQGNEHPQRNLHPPDDLLDDGIVAGTRQGFGLEGPDMTGRREFYLPDHQIEALKEINLGSDDDGLSFEKKSRLNSDIADMYGGDMVYQRGEDTLGMNPKFRRSMDTLHGRDTDLSRGDMEQAVARDSGFGLEPKSMAKRRARLSEIEQEAISTNYKLGGSWADAPEGEDGRRRGMSRNVLKRQTIKSGKRASDLLDSFDNKLKRIKPSMGMMYSIIAAIIPIAVALGTQLLGVAAAMGAVAAAGAGIMGLGLLGHGESMEESMEQAKQQVGDLKEELFEAFQPTMQQFAPMQARMFDAIPDGLGGVAEAMEGLTAYEDTLFALGGSLADGMERAIDIIVANEKAISQLSIRFGRLIGSGLLDFFEWLIQAASENQKLLVQLGSDMLQLVVVAYNLSMAIAQILTAFSLWVDILVILSELLNSDLVVAFIQIIGLLYMIGRSAALIYALGVGFQVLTNFVFNATYAMFGYELSTWGAVAATLALVTAISMLTFGASAVLGGIGTVGGMGDTDIPTSGGAGGGGMGGYGGGGGGTTVYNDNRSYEIGGGGMDDYATQKDVESSIIAADETDAAQDRP